MAELAAVYCRLVATRVRADWQYRTSFVLFTASQFLVTLLDFVAIAVIFGQVPALDGWSLAEVAFLYGTSGVAFGLADAVTSAVERVAVRIRTGTFDQLLVRPLGPLFQLSADEFAFRRVGKIAQAAGVLVVALARLDVDWTAGRALMVPAMIAAGFVIYSALWVVTSSLAFWTVETQEVANAFTYGGNYLTQYPLGIYARWLKHAALLLGLASVNYLPALYVLGRDDDLLGLPAAARFTSPIVAALTGAAAWAVWRVAIRHYRSTGS